MGADLAKQIQKGIPEHLPAIKILELLGIL